MKRLVVGLVVVAGAAAGWFVQGREVLAALRQAVADPPTRPADFTPSWLASRDHLAGHSTYRPLAESAADHAAELGPLDLADLPSVNAHPPFTTLLTLPASRLGYAEALRRWNALNAGLLVVALALIATELFPRRPLAWAVLSAVVLTSGPVLDHFRCGNWSVVLLLLLTAAWMLHRRGKAVAAGLTAAVVVLVKLFPVVVLLHFAGRRDWRAVVALCGGVIVGCAVTVAVIGVGDHRLFVTRVVPENWVNPTAGLVAVAAAVPYLSLIARRRETSLDVSLAAIVCLILLVGPIASAHSLLLAVLPVAILATRVGAVCGALLAVASAVLWAHPPLSGVVPHVAFQTTALLVIYVVALCQLCAGAAGHRRV